MIVFSEAADDVNSRGTFRNRDCRWMVSRVSERYLFGLPVCCCRSVDFCRLASRQRTSLGCARFCRGNDSLFTAALKTRGSAGQKIDATNKPNNTASRRGVRKRCKVSISDSRCRCRMRDKITPKALANFSPKETPKALANFSPKETPKAFANFSPAVGASATTLGYETIKKY